MNHEEGGKMIRKLLCLILGLMIVLGPAGAAFTQSACSTGGAEAKDPAGEKKEAGKGTEKDAEKKESVIESDDEDDFFDPDEGGGGE